MAGMQPVVDQLRALEDTRKDGTIALPGGTRLGVTNLAKLFWPKLKLTKGDLLRYYATVAPLILPVVADRPLVMKRFPNGVDDRVAFYQQRRQKEQPPAGVRIEALPDDLDPVVEPGAERFIGGSLITLLYMTQLAAISQDPWFSRVQSPLDADFVALDLDPGEGATLAQVLDVARWVRDELESMKVPGVPKTSGSRGLHIYIPLPPGTSYESGQLFCQIVATVIAARHPKVATVERMVKKRRRGTVYVDFLQNILGKTLACAYSARASDFAGVSTPLTWDEVEAGVDPRDFTIVTAPARFREVGDLWARLRTSKPARLETVFGKYWRVIGGSQARATPAAVGYDRNRWARKTASRRRQRPLSRSASASSPGISSSASVPIALTRRRREDVGLCEEADEGAEHCGLHWSVLPDEGGLPADLRRWPDRAGVSGGRVVSRRHAGKCRAHHPAASDRRTGGGRPVLRAKPARPCLAALTRRQIR